jgi:hypothetical protein
LVYVGLEAADHRSLREAFENQIRIIYFLGIALCGYQAMLSTRSGNPGAARIAGRQRSRSGKKVIERIK